MALDHATQKALDRALCAQATDLRLPARARLAARDTLRRLDRGAFQPMHVAMHGDMHLGNVLLDLGCPQRFVLIDWCGASAQGWPLFDLMRTAESLQVSDARLRAELRAHCELLSPATEPRLSPAVDDAAAHLTLGLAMLGAQLEHFPFDMYVALLDRVYARFDAATHAPALGQSAAARHTFDLEGRYA
jgi:hypothetical protein